MLTLNIQQIGRTMGGTLLFYSGDSVRIEPAPLPADA